MSAAEWRPTLGAVVGDGRTLFRVWAPRPRDLVLEIAEGGAWRPVTLEPEGEYRVADVAGLGAGARYRYVVGGVIAPDPCSRSQPDGVHLASEVVDPRSFAWDDSSFEPVDVADVVLYECHIGTLTPEGTFDAAIGQLRRLRQLGINVIEVMPVASFPGRWNWGYDGAALFAPAAVYGGPDGLRRFVNAAHGEGLAVILDVVFNHFGPSGNYTGVFSEHYTTPRHKTPWGDAVNFDDEGAAEVRRFFAENLLMWVHEYHIDGFRLDATHEIRDDSPRRILAELHDAIGAHRHRGRRPYLYAETIENDVRYLEPREAGGYGFDGVWADDFHHCVRTIIHGEREGYLGSYSGSASELARTIEHGFFFEGQFDAATGTERGTPAPDQPWRQFVYCIQNHDQVGNRAQGLRLNTTASLGDYLAATTLLLLLPQTPLLFQGQEFLASTPFLYFTDHDAELGRAVTEGRRAEFAAFAAFRDPAAREAIPDPQAERTYRQSQLRHSEATYGAGALVLAYYRELLRLRAHDEPLRVARRGRTELRAQAWGAAVTVEIVWNGERRVIAANFGGEADAELEGCETLETVICSDEPRYGGFGRSPAVREGRLVLPPHSGTYFRGPANLRP
ncbi:MAG: malto-oligosyltrehalose trehalohydrolase [Chloroflexi bacterium]|nr:malto-oligosyltrehalose trehalohydrolase [Chloroflexota bacterium]